MNIKLLKELCLAAGTSGQEENIRKIVRREIEKHVDSIEIDAMGNLIALKKGKSSDKRIMTAAHMDEIGFLINHIDKNGFARFLTVGGFDPKTFTAQRVIVHGKKDLVGIMGSKPKHIMTPEEMKKAPSEKDFFIDFGLPEKEVKKYIQVGDFATRERDLVELGDNVCTKSLDNRVSVFMLVEILKKLKKPAYDFYGVFTVQEEVGLRGATTSAERIKPDFAIVMDTTIANDTPGSPEHEQYTRLGEGCAIKVYDSVLVADTRMVRFIEETANKKKIKTQKVMYKGGGTDAGAMQRAGYGAITSGIVVPTRYVHSVVEMCNKNDVDCAINLMIACVETMDKFKYEWK